MAQLDHFRLRPDQAFLMVLPDSWDSRYFRPPAFAMLRLLCPHLYLAVRFGHGRVLRSRGSFRG